MDYRRYAPFLVLALSGCASEVPPFETDQVEPAIELATSYDAAKTGRISGQVRWKGPIPHPQGFLYGRPRADGAGFEFRTAENPNRPRIDAKTRAVADAVVFLRGVPATASKSWDLPSVTVEIGDGKITVIQGKHRGRAGFVRRGDEISVTSTDKTYQLLRGRGDAFFGLALPEPGRPVTRTLTKAGRVELSSGTGLYWARADLFVADHPYYTLTDQHGQFSFDHVPMGDLEVVVWMPGWHPARMERDPDSTQVARQQYSPPIEKTARATIRPAQPTAISISIP